MKTSRLFRLCAISLVVGAAVFAAHVVGRSVLTALHPDLAALAASKLWVTLNAVGAAGATLVLLGMPGMYLATASRTGVPGFLGVVLIALGWIFLALFLSLYGALIAPWLAGEAPALLSRSASLPAGVVATFALALASQLSGSLLLAVPFLRGRARPGWIGLLLPAAGLASVAGVLIAPSGPAPNLAQNLISNLGPVLLSIALATLGHRMWSRRDPAPPSCEP